MKIALVGPGLLPIPPSGWGAIETLIWKYSELFIKQGHEVIIFNSQDIAAVVVEINSTDFDFIHVHYDEFAYYFSKYCKKPFCITSHYGYLLKKNRWSKGYFSIFVDFLNVPGIIALSPEIQKMYLSAGYKGPIYVLRNSIDKNLFTYTAKGNGKIICLGKIEPRKQQSILSRMLEGKIAIDFVGPIADTSFKPGLTSQYKGVWSKEEVQQKLTQYSTLILLSDGEAAPLVVIEALMAGVSVVISRSSAANLTSQPFITLLDDNESNPQTIVNALHSSVEKNDYYREHIRNYAIEQFHTKTAMEDYYKIISDFSSCSLKKTVARSHFIKQHFFEYYFSRIWLWFSKINFLRWVKKSL